MEQLGFGPRSTPSWLLHTGAEGGLRAYQPPRRDRPALLAVPAPIKTAYIWDLAPEYSVVRRCLDAALQVYLIDWARPQSADARRGLAEYVSFIECCVALLAEETGQARILLAGHSLGGTLAAIAASLRPELILGLLELEGPMHFGPPGRLEAAARLAPPGATAGAEALIPGSLLDTWSLAADPLSFGLAPWLDAWRSLASPAAQLRHARVRRWTLDETPLPRRLFDEVVQELYRDDRFAGRTLTLAGRRADPHALTAPIAAVLDPRSRVVPAAAVAAYAQCTGSREVELLEYGGDTGVLLQHVGVLVGENAHRTLWPALLAWARRVSGARAARH